MENHDEELDSFEYVEDNNKFDEFVDELFFNNAFGDDDDSNNKFLSTLANHVGRALVDETVKFIADAKKTKNRVEVIRAQGDEERKTVVVKAAAAAAVHSRETDDQIRLEEARWRTEKDKIYYNEIEIPLLKRQYGLDKPNSASSTTQPVDVSPVPEAAQDDSWKRLLRTRPLEEKDRGVSLDEIQNAPDPEVLQGVIFQGLTLIAAQEKSGKSTFSYQIAEALVKGEMTDILPQKGKAIKQPVHYYDLENSASVIKQHYEKRIADILNKGLTLSTDKYEGKELLESIAKKVVKLRYEHKYQAYIIDCIYQFDGDEVKELQEQAKNICDNALDDFGCQVSILIVQHLNGNKQVKGTKNLERVASTIFRLTQSEEDEDVVNVTWLGRCTPKGGTTLVRKGPREGYDGDIHFEPYEVPAPQLDSVLNQTQCTQEAASAMSPIASEMPYRLTADTFGKLNNSEKLAIYGLVRQELVKNVTGKELSERMQRRLGVTVSPTIVSSIKTDKEGNMRKGYNDGGVDKNVVNKVRELYLSQNQ